MSNNLLQIVDNSLFEGKVVRITGSFENPWFVAKDICDILGLNNVTNAVKHIPDKWRSSKILNTISGDQNVNIINESGLYKLVMRSNKPIAQKFQEWVCDDVLPNIRKKGEYRMNEEYQLKLTAIENEKKKLEEEKDYAEHLLKQKEDHIKKLQRETQIVDGKNVVYLCTTDDQEPKGVFTVGKAINLKNRLQAYNNNKLHNFKVVKYISCKSARLMDCIEQMILHKLNKYKIFSNRDVFQLPDGKDVYFFTQWFDYLNKMCDDIEDDIVIEDRTDEEEHELLNEKKEEFKEDKSDAALFERFYYSEPFLEVLKSEEKDSDEFVINIKTNKRKVDLELSERVKKLKITPPTYANIPSNIPTYNSTPALKSSYISPLITGTDIGSNIFLTSGYSENHKYQPLSIQNTPIINKNLPLASNSQLLATSPSVSLPNGSTTAAAQNFRGPVPPTNPNFPSNISPFLYPQYAAMMAGMMQSNSASQGNNTTPAFNQASMILQQQLIQDNYRRQLSNNPNMYLQAAFYQQQAQNQNVAQAQTSMATAIAAANQATTSSPLSSVASTVATPLPITTSASK